MYHVICYCLILYCTSHHVGHSLFLRVWPHCRCLNLPRYRTNLATSRSNDLRTTTWTPSHNTGTLAQHHSVHDGNSLCQLTHLIVLGVFTVTLFKNLVHISWLRPSQMVAPTSMVVQLLIHWSSLAHQPEWTVRFLNHCQFTTQYMYLAPSYNIRVLSHNAGGIDCLFAKECIEGALSRASGKVAKSYVGVLMWVILNVFFSLLLGAYRG